MRSSRSGSRTTGSRPQSARRPSGEVDLADRLLGAWTGRAAGCLLGKPVEKIPRHGIREILQSQGRWPLTDWFTAAGLPDDLATRWPWNRRSAPTSLAENIDGMPEDDDLNFPMLALDLVERLGSGFTTDDVAAAWLANLPGGRVFTAERVAYRNLLLGETAPATATRHNPFREWIGAQIRTDLYGWVHPGDPTTASRLARTDARLSHVRNGVYGGMFAAAACAQAVVSDKVDEVDDVVATGLSVLPPRSRYAEAIRFGVELARSTTDTERAFDRLYEEYGHLHWVHVLNNAALTAYALTVSRGDFDTAITTVVMGGWDTDSNGATVGSVCGALAGAAALPDRWVGAASQPRLEQPARLRRDRPGRTRRPHSRTRPDAGGHAMSRDHDVVVLGSANLDLVSTVPTIPAPGETVLSLTRDLRAGGKGLNQAVAASRAGARTLLVGAVGDDEAARLLTTEAEGAGIDTGCTAGGRPQRDGLDHGAPRRGERDRRRQRRERHGREPDRAGARRDRSRPRPGHPAGDAVGRRNGGGRARSGGRGPRGAERRACPAAPRRAPRLRRRAGRQRARGPPPVRRGRPGSGGRRAGTGGRLGGRDPRRRRCPARGRRRAAPGRRRAGHRRRHHRGRRHVHRCPGRHPRRARQSRRRRARAVVAGALAVESPGAVPSIPTAAQIDRRAGR